MDNNNILELLDVLYGMVTEAWSVPLGNDKCIIEREKAVEIINEIKNNLPASVAEAQRLVAARDDFIGSAKREAESLRKSAEEKSRAMIEEQEIMREARARSSEILSAAEQKSKELRRLAGEYVDNIMRQSEETMSAALNSIRDKQKAFRSAAVGAVPIKMAAEQSNAAQTTQVTPTPAKRPITRGAAPLPLGLGDEEEEQESRFRTVSVNGD